MYSAQDTPFRVGFPIRTSADQRSLASPRGLSQRATSFIAFWRQGIHRTPFIHSSSPPPARRTKTHHRNLAAPPACPGVLRVQSDKRFTHRHTLLSLGPRPARLSASAARTAQNIRSSSRVNEHQDPRASGQRRAGSPGRGFLETRAAPRPATTIVACRGQLRRANSSSRSAELGDDRDRTDDPLLAKQALSR
jgi:hypothetical protein